MKQRDYERLRREIEERYKGDLAALERIWQMAQGMDSNAAVEVAPRIEGLTEAVRAILPDLNEPFNLRSVIARLNDNPDQQIVEAARNRPSSISTVLKRIEKAGEIRLIEKGSGKRASSYGRGNLAHGGEALPLQAGDIN
jgi:predicted transcriptional regulator